MKRADITSCLHSQKSTQRKDRIKNIDKVRPKVEQMFLLTKIQEFYVQVQEFVITVRNKGGTIS